MLLRSPFFLFIAPASLQSSSPHYTTAVNLQGGPCCWPVFYCVRDGYRTAETTGSGSEASKPRPAVFAGDAPWKDRKPGLRYDTSCVNGGVIFEWVDTLNGFTDLLAGKIEIIEIGRAHV